MNRGVAEYLSLICDVGRPPRVDSLHSEMCTRMAALHAKRSALLGGLTAVVQPPSARASDVERWRKPVLALGEEILEVGQQFLLHAEAEYAVAYEYCVDIFLRMKTSFDEAGVANEAELSEPPFKERMDECVRHLSDMQRLFDADLEEYALGLQRDADHIGQAVEGLTEFAVGAVTVWYKDTDSEPQIAEEVDPTLATAYQQNARSSAEQQLLASALDRLRQARDQLQPTGEPMREWMDVWKESLEKLQAFYGISIS